MAGTIKCMIDAIIAKRSRGNATIAMTTRTKIFLKGINPDIYNMSSPDDPAVIEKLRGIARDLGVSL
ncbi:hypothetical protein GTO89_06535 [Heliobacterium gestii]|uniref:Uncharacterized protein n=1 Tax=Heliomicrobium gestii TaxID=2699 RepID=A0A845LE08_HELGE|nr:hypothetical protein [Heliomicrobium gestii]MBM7865970.1 hypothetical protein [Heliomicrobium gestii]MZP42695.1 hypothetical protein [Heliomicrobium gestii]